MKHQETEGKKTHIWIVKCQNSQRIIHWKYYPGQKNKNRYSRDICEADLQVDHVVSCGIDFDLQCELTTRRYRRSHRCPTEVDMIELQIDLLNISGVTIFFFWPG